MSTRDDRTQLAANLGMTMAVAEQMERERDDARARLRAAESAITTALSMLQDDCVDRRFRAIDALVVLREHANARALVGDETPGTGERA